MAKEKHQVLLRGSGWIVRRDTGSYSYRLEGDLATDANVAFEGSLPLQQEDVAKLFNSEGKEWRYE